MAEELTEKDALAAYVRDELGINVISQAKPLKAAWPSDAAFSTVSIVPLLIKLFMPLDQMEYYLYCFAIFFLIILGILAAKTGGSSIKNAIIEITFWGTIAMALTALVGRLFGVSLI